MMMWKKEQEREREGRGRVKGAEVEELGRRTREEMGSFGVMWKGNGIIDFY